MIIEQLTSNNERIWRTLTSLFLIFCFLFLTGCPNAFLNKPGLDKSMQGTQVNIPEGFGAVRVSFVQGIARTVMPTPVLSAFHHLTYLFAKDGGVPTELIPQDDLFILEPGSFELTVKAYMTADENSLAAQGSSEIFTITAGKINPSSAIVTMHPFASGEGTGTLEFSVVYPAGIMVEIFTLSLIAGDETYDLMDTEISITEDDPVTFSGNIVMPVGYYLLQIKLKGTDGESAGTAEVVHIYRNMVTITSPENYTFTAADFVSGNVPGSGLAAKLLWLQTNAQSGGDYIIEVDKDENIYPQILSYSGRNNITITLRSTGLTYKIGLSSKGSLFTIDSGVTLILENNIILRGLNMADNGVDNNAPVVQINADGSFIMEGGEISGNTRDGNDDTGGGVDVFGSFTMKDGTISGNTSFYLGGSVYVGSSGSFFMEGGIIFGSKANSGGGVCSNGIFTMTGGTISGNEASYSGGGVYTNGTFIMMGGNIFGNKANSNGGGVCAAGIFNKSGNSIITGWGDDTAKGNVVMNSSDTVLSNRGHAVYTFNENTATVDAIRKETTAGGWVNLTFDGTANPAIWSGYWKEIEVPGDDLAEKLGWLETYSQTDCEYIIVVYVNENIAPHVLSYSGRNNVSITLIGTGSTQTIGLLSNGSLFTIESGVTLVLDDTVTLRGRNLSQHGTMNNAPVVQVNSGGTFRMNGGEISGNSTSNNAGGVVVSSGDFTMTGGTITKNFGGYNAGGVYVDDGGSFTMEGGTICDNEGNYNGGVELGFNGCTFIMKNGTISGNICGDYSLGGGVYVNDKGTFTMEGGTISGNKADEGGGVYVSWGGSFSMEDGIISGNKADDGGGVYADWGGSFIMKGGTISENSATSKGGGVLVYIGGTFTKSSNSVITGWANDTINGNVVKDSSGIVANNRGHGVCVIWSYQVSASIVKRLETTAGIGTNLSYESLAFGFGNPVPPTWSGEWETNPLAEQLMLLQFNVQSGGDYIIDISEDENIGSWEFSNYGVENITITLRNTGLPRTIGFSSNNGPMFTIGYGYTLILEDDITLYRQNKMEAVEYNLVSVIEVNGGAFILKGGTISGNNNLGSAGGVSVSVGSFTMEGGTISGNIGGWGGGVYVGSGTFTMEGGNISENTGFNGGGVYVNSYGSFIMNGGTISGNTANYRGGGVYVNGYGIFSKSFGSIITGWGDDITNGNVVKDDVGTVINDKGHAVYAERGSTVKRQETTAGTEFNLSFDGTNDPPDWEGNWDF